MAMTLFLVAFPFLPATAETATEIIFEGVSAEFDYYLGSQDGKSLFQYADENVSAGIYELTISINSAVSGNIRFVLSIEDKDGVYTIYLKPESELSDNDFFRVYPIGSAEVTEVMINGRSQTVSNGNFLLDPCNVNDNNRIIVTPATSATPSEYYSVTIPPATDDYLVVVNSTTVEKGTDLVFTVYRGEYLPESTKITPRVQYRSGATVTIGEGIPATEAMPGYGAGTTYIVSIIADCTISVSVTDGFNITYVGNGNYTLSDAPNSVAQGGNFTFTVIPDDGYYIKSVMIGSINITSGDVSDSELFGTADRVGNTYTITNVKDNLTVSVETALANHKITVTVPKKGVTTSASYGEVVHGGNYEFRVAAAPGYAKPTVYVNGVELSGVNDVYTIRNIDRDVEIVIEAGAINRFTVTGLVDTDAYTIDIIDGVSEKSDSVEVNYGTAITLKITPKAGYEGIAKVYENGIPVTANEDGTYTIEIKSNVEITVGGLTRQIFTVTIPIETTRYLVYASAPTVSYGDSVIITLNLKTGYIIASDISLDKILTVVGGEYTVTVSGSVYTFTITDIKGNVTVKVNEEALIHKINEYLKMELISSTCENGEWILKASVTVDTDYLGEKSVVNIFAYGTLMVNGKGAAEAEDDLRNALLNGNLTGSGFLNGDATRYVFYYANVKGLIVDGKYDQTISGVNAGDDYEALLWVLVEIGDQMYVFCTGVGTPDGLA